MQGYGASQLGTRDGWRRAALGAAALAFLALGGCATITILETPLTSDKQNKQRQALQHQAEAAVNLAVASGWADPPNTTSLADILLNGIEPQSERADPLSRYIAAKPKKTTAARASVRSDLITARNQVAALAESVEAVLAKERKPPPPGEELASLERVLIIYKRAATMFAAAEARLRGEAGDVSPSDAQATDLQVELLAAELDRLTSGVNRLAGRGEADAGS